MRSVPSRPRLGRGLGIMAIVSRFFGYLAALCLLSIAGIILLEIVLRTFFATSTFMMNELVGYGVALMAFLGFAVTFREGAHIRVNLLLSRLKPGSLARIMVELFCVAATLVVTGLAIWHFYLNVAREYARGYSSGTMSNMPLWIPEGIMLLGFVVFWLQLLEYGLRVAFRGELMQDQTKGD